MSEYPALQALVEYPGLGGGLENPEYLEYPEYPEYLGPLAGRPRPPSLLASVLDEPVDVVLGAVLRGGHLHQGVSRRYSYIYPCLFALLLAAAHLKDVGDAQEGLLGLLVGDDLQDGEVLQHAVHHVFLRKVLQFADEVDHVLAHGAAVQLVDEPLPLAPRIFRLHLLHHLLAEAAHLGGHLDCHVLLTFVPGEKNKLVPFKTEMSNYVVIVICKLLICARFFIPDSMKHIHLCTFKPGLCFVGVLQPVFCHVSNILILQACHHTATFGKKCWGSNFLG